jgi:hypothetical protein
VSLNTTFGYSRTIPIGNVYVNDGRVLYLNAFHAEAPVYLGGLARPKIVFGTDTSPTTEQLGCGLARCGTAKVFGTVSCVETEQQFSTKRLECSIEQSSFGEAPASDDLRQA